jgi:glycerophosphoryl diester phosphodiesterase
MKSSVLSGSGDMKSFEIVAHRGIPGEEPENTIASYQLALELGADAVEMDIRLTADQVPVVFHYYYLEKSTHSKGVIFQYTLQELDNVDVICSANPDARAGRISTFTDILDRFGGQIGLEIEIKGPEPEAPLLVGQILNRYRHLWDSFEITSYDPALLLAIQEVCPGITVDLLYPRTEAWKGPEVILYEALHLSRLCHALAVHLHPSQLSEVILKTLKSQGIQAHAWDVNDENALAFVTGIGVPRICTDEFRMAQSYRTTLKGAQSPASKI